MKLLLPLLLLSVAASAQDAEIGKSVVVPAAEVVDAPAKRPEEAPPVETPKPLPKPSLAEEPAPAPASAASPAPAPAPVPAPKEEPKPETVKEAAKGVSAEDEFSFAKAAAEDADSATQEAAIDELDLFYRRHPDHASAPEAAYLKASLMAKKGDWQPALAALLRLIHEHAGSKTELKAKSAYLELVDKKASRRHRGPLQALVAVSDAPKAADRLSAVWQKLADTAPDAVYEPAAEEIRSVFARFPDLKDGDRLQASLARLHAANGKNAAAVLAWRKLLAAYPASALRPAAQMAVGDLYSDALRDPKKAIDAYQELVAQYPKASEVLPALEKSAKLFDDKLRQYGLAVEMHEKVIKLFPKTPSSLAALKSVAKLQRDRLGSPGEAVKTLQRLSTMHGGQEGVDALLQAADIARRDLKDDARQADLLRKVSDDYAGAKEAPQALYDAASVYEDSIKDAKKAVELYREVASKFPSHKLAKRAEDRAAKLEAKN